MDDKSIANEGTVYLLYHYFAPDDVVSARLFSDLAETLHHAGRHVVAMPGIRSCHDDQLAFAKNESWNGIEIKRVWRPAWKQSSNKGRIGNAVFLLSSWFIRSLVTKRRKNEFMIVGTDPILGVLAAIPWRIFRPKAKIIHWCHDVYPHAAVADNLLSPTSTLVRLLNRLLRFAYRRCDALVDLGPCMRRLVLHAAGAGTELLESNARSVASHQPNKSKSSTKFCSITPWSLVEPAFSAEADASCRKELFSSAKLGLLYSGNLGRAHQLEPFLKLSEYLAQHQLIENHSRVAQSALVNAANELLETNRSSSYSQSITFCFAGRGPRVAELAQSDQMRHDNIRIAKFAPESELTKRLSAADIHLVSLQESWTGSVVPSKFFGALAVGRPVLFAGSRDSSIAIWIESFQVGWILSSDRDIEVVAEDLQRLACDNERLETLKKHCFQVYHREFAQKVQANRWLELMSELTEVS